MAWGQPDPLPSPPPPAAAHSSAGTHPALAESPRHLAVNLLAAWGVVGLQGLQGLPEAQLSVEDYPSQHCPPHPFLLAGLPQGCRCLGAGRHELGGAQGPDQSSAGA